MCKILKLIIFFFVGHSINCFSSERTDQTIRSYTYQFSCNYARFGSIDKNAIILKNSINKELKNGKLSFGLNFGGGQLLRNDFFYVNHNGKEYTDFLDRESMIYSNVLYSIRPINSKFIKFYLGVGPALGYFSKKYYQFWIKESDLDRYIYLMGEYQDGFDVGYSIDVQLLIKAFNNSHLVIKGGFDSFFKYQSLLYFGVGVQLN